MARRVNAETFAKIKQFEGLRLTAYRNFPGEPWTIGYGRAHGVHEGDTCTKAQAEAWLRQDLRTAEEIVERAVEVELTDNQFGALVSFVFNVGAGRKGVKDGLVTLKNGKPSMLLRRLNAGDYESALAEFPKWVNVNGRPARGLANRRAAEMGLWAKGEYVAGQTVEPERPKANRGEIRTVSTAATGGGMVVLGEAVSKLEALAAYSDTIRLVFLVGAMVMIAAPVVVALRRRKNEGG